MSPSAKTATTNRTQQHYATVLAPIYKWMLGDFSSAIERSRAELKELGVGSPRATRSAARALDLGAGCGLQTLPLVELGYETTAVDGSEALLSELSAACPEAHTVRADLATIDEYIAGAYDVIVCMGDTLTHLGSENDVRALLVAASAHLAPAGLFILTFRDYSGPPRRSTDRFIFVRGDAERVLTCCLDYDADRVVVTDIVHEFAAGKWTLRASEYEKLRLSPSAIVSELTACGLSVERCESNSGRVSVVARRAA
jgi:2-polyprenyl-3-methyl-5-hydroxy-6-metoxy-1,4-benzoquinol methylase